MLKLHILKGPFGLIENTQGISKKNKGKYMNNYYY